MSQQNHHAAGLSRASAAGVLIALGVIYGDIGTSPLYVMKAIVGARAIDERLVLGGLSCVFWTLTILTTIKYVILTLRADNNGEGGIFSLYALVRRRKRWLMAPAIIGGSALLADGVLTPSISISSAIEGLRQLDPQINTLPIVIAILSGLFFVQQFGTSVIGRAFGPIMFVWFTMLFVLGFINILDSPGVLAALSPHYAIDLLTNYPGGFWLLGGVFLCTTGAEALYSDLGHCGRANIRVSWGFVKLALITNYFGQGAWILTHAGDSLAGRNPFYQIMPDWFLVPGIIIATLATIIASQALISGSFTLVSEAILLQLWPKSRIVYPTEQKGQLYLPGVNLGLWAGCVMMMLVFRESEHMEAAYGLSITMTMMATTLLLFNYMRKEGYSSALSYGVLATYLAIEAAFLLANIDKLIEGAWLTLLIASVLTAVMLVWQIASRIKRRYARFESMRDQLPILKAMSADESIPKFATHLIYPTGSTSREYIEGRVMYSLFRKQPKRADVYWFIHITTLDEPHAMRYKVDVMDKDDVIWIEFQLGFRVQPRINMLFRKAVEELVANNEVNITSRYPSLKQFNLAGDFRFVMLESYLAPGLPLPLYEKIVMDIYFFLRRYSLSDEKAFGLDTSSVTLEKIPLAVPQHRELRLERIYDAPAAN